MSVTGTGVKVGVPIKSPAAVGVGVKVTLAFGVSVFRAAHVENAEGEAVCIHHLNERGVTDGVVVWVQRPCQWRVEEGVGEISGSA